MSSFHIQVKSTLDKVMADLVDTLQTSLATELGSHTLHGVEVDNLVQTDEIIKGEDPALLWQFMVVTENPRDPLYRVEFLVGVKTAADAGNYLMAHLISALGDSFKSQNVIDIHDYSGAVAGPKIGYMIVSRNTMTPQQSDNLSGIRFFSVIANGVRMG